MKAQFNLVQERKCRKSPRPAGLDGRPKAWRQDRYDNTIQVIYAHLPSATVLALSQHLRAQTNIEQHAHQLWFARGCGSGDALGDWVRAEREVLQNLCQALRRLNTREPEAG